jgi:hypothetical protein
LYKHVAIRNCIQHHGGQWDKGALDECGVSKFTIKKSSGEIELKAWETVRLSFEEVIELTAILRRLATDFGTHVFDRVPARQYLKAPDSN